MPRANSDYSGLAKAARAIALREFEAKKAEKEVQESATAVEAK